MLLTEITDDPLKDLELQMLLRSTESHVSQAQAEKTLHFLRNAAQIIGGAQKQPLSVYLDKKSGCSGYQAPPYPPAGDQWAPRSQDTAS